MKQISSISILLLLFISRSVAQTSKEAMTKKKADSVKMVYLNAAAIQYPILRQVSVSTDIMSGGDITGKLNGNDLFKAKVQLTRIRASFNLPIAQWGKNGLTANVSYLHQHIDLSQVTSYNPQIPVANAAFNTTTVALTASYTRMDTLFNHPVIYSASITGLTDELSRVRSINEIVGINVPLKRTATTSFSTGLYYINNPMSPIHVLPFFSYWHQFQTGDIQLFVDLPTRFLLKKQLSAKSWISFGTELGGSQSFLTFSPPLPHDAVSSTLELKAGPAFEYRLTKKVILGVSGGMSSTLSSRIFKKGDTPSDYFINSSNNSVPYINFSISVLPFLKAISNR